MIRYVHYTLATFLGTGFSPLAPGTAGSILAVLIFWLFPMNTIWWILLIGVVLLAGVSSATFVEKERGHDPGVVVIDEAVGQWISYLFVIISPARLITGFILFRLFDITKPFPINHSQNLRAGWGIMIDDVLAGIFANICLHILIYLEIL